ncbi:hypothetical protein AVEN_194340-1 [Araneus ventricosus]|uniref:Uncharacterized protein n=1 Tax=Araneus ventricosus TaxID=182803 RepID=A0A4Y2TEB2_ARAVE|nr:hypothetical protein AVEN_194340-1 [Araneus ventricosus]
MSRENFYTVPPIIVPGTQIHPSLKSLYIYVGKSLMPQFQLHKILCAAFSSTAGLLVERRHHLQSVCLQDVALVDQTDEKSDRSVLQHPPYT